MLNRQVETFHLNKLKSKRIWREQKLIHFHLDNSFGYRTLLMGEKNDPDKSKYL